MNGISRRDDLWFFSVLFGTLVFGASTCRLQTPLAFSSPGRTAKTVGSDARKNGSYRSSRRVTLELLSGGLQTLSPFLVLSENETHTHHSLYNISRCAACHYIQLQPLFTVANYS